MVKVWPNVGRTGVWNMEGGAEGMKHDKRGDNPDPLSQLGNLTQKGSPLRGSPVTLTLHPK